MNERIKELKEQATIETPIGHGIVKYVFSPEKFAELIVRECIMLCEKVEQTDNVKIRAGATFCREDIKEHFFGVEL